jgi:signal transduction histidine kinase
LVYAIIKEYDGEIKINSSKGKGTTVNIFLPTVKPKKENKIGKKERKKDKEKNTGKS